MHFRETMLQISVANHQKKTGSHEPVYFFSERVLQVSKEQPEEQNLLRVLDCCNRKPNGEPQASDQASFREYA